MSASARRSLRRSDQRPTLSALVPNEKGMQRSSTGTSGRVERDRVSVFTAASETFEEHQRVDR